MKSHATKSFWIAHAKLPEVAKVRAHEAYALFSHDPSHPSLRFKCVLSNRSLYSVRVTHGYRALGILDGNTVTWIWIGGHAEYDRIIGKG